MGLSFDRALFSRTNYPLSISKIICRSCLSKWESFISTKAPILATEFLQLMFIKSLKSHKTKMALKKAKEDGKRLGRPIKHDYDKVIELRLNGLSYREIIDELKVPPGVIHRALKSKGLLQRNMSKKTKPACK